MNCSPTKRFPWSLFRMCHILIADKSLITRQHKLLPKFKRRPFLKVAKIGTKASKEPKNRSKTSILVGMADLISDQIMKEADHLFLEMLEC